MTSPVNESIAGSRSERASLSNPYNDMYCEYRCGHVVCSSAPDPSIYTRRCDKLVWLRAHEMGTRQGNVPMHGACMTRLCNRCFELWGCNMRDYILDGEKRESNRSAYEKFGLRGNSGGSCGSVASIETPLRRSARTLSSSEPSSHSLTPRGDDLFNANDGRVSVTTTTTTVSFPATAASVALVLSHQGSARAAAAHISDSKSTSSVPSGRVYDEMKSEVADYATIMEDLVEFLEDLPITSPHRWPVVARKRQRVLTIASDCSGSQSCPHPLQRLTTNYSIVKMNMNGANFRAFVLFIAGFTAVNPN